MDPPKLRKKHTSNDKKKNKVFVYNQKSIRIKEQQIQNNISKRS